MIQYAFFVSFPDFSRSQTRELFVATLHLQIKETHAGSQAELRHRVDSAIKRNPHLNGYKVFCQEECGIVVLHGRVSSFFQKQMAQESLKRLEGVEKVINQLEVDWHASVEC